MIIYFSYVGILLLLVLLRILHNISEKGNQENKLLTLQLQKPIDTQIIDQNLDLLITGKRYNIKMNGIYLWTNSRKVDNSHTKSISIALAFNAEKVVKYDTDAELQLRIVDGCELYNELFKKEFEANTPDISSYNLNEKNISTRFRLEKGTYLEIDGELTMYGLKANLSYSVINYMDGSLTREGFFENAEFNYIGI